MTLAWYQQHLPCQGKCHEWTSFTISQIMTNVNYYKLVVNENLMPSDSLGDLSDSILVYTRSMIRSIYKLVQSKLALECKYQTLPGCTDKEYQQPSHCDDALFSQCMQARDIPAFARGVCCLLKPAKKGTSVMWPLVAVLVMCYGGLKMTNIYIPSNGIFRVWEFFINELASCLTNQLMTKLIMTSLS